MVSYGDTSFPIGYEVVKKDIQFCDVETRRLKRRANISKNTYFTSLLHRCKANNVLFEYVLADNWFGSKANMEYIHCTLKKKFIIGIKSPYANTHLQIA